jgi:hypothetical protein
MEDIDAGLPESRSRRTARSLRANDSPRTPIWPKTALTRRSAGFKIGFSNYQKQGPTHDEPDPRRNAEDRNGSHASRAGRRAKKSLPAMSLRTPPAAARRQRGRVAVWASFSERSTEHMASPEWRELDPGLNRRQNRTAETEKRLPPPLPSATSCEPASARCWRPPVKLKASKPAARESAPIVRPAWVPWPWARTGPAWL